MKKKLKVNISRINIELNIFEKEWEGPGFPIRSGLGFEFLIGLGHIYSFLAKFGLNWIRFVLIQSFSVFFGNAGYLWSFFGYFWFNLVSLGQTWSFLCLFLLVLRLRQVISRQFLVIFSCSWSRLVVFGQFWSYLAEITHGWSNFFVLGWFWSNLVLKSFFFQNLLSQLNSYLQLRQLIIRER